MKNNIFASNLEKNDPSKLKIGMLLCHYLFNLDANREFKYLHFLEIYGQKC